MLRTPLALLVLALPAAAQLAPGPSIDTSFQPPDSVVEFFSGAAASGQPDPSVSVRFGPAGTPFPQAFTAADFRQAKYGPPAFVLSGGPWSFQSLSSQPKARWIATHPDAGAGFPHDQSGLYAISFEMPPGPYYRVLLDFTFGVDDFLGSGPNAGLYLNEVAIPGSTFPTQGYTGERTMQGLDVTTLVRPGENTLYVNAANTGGACGVMFHGRVRVNTPYNDDCETAQFVPGGLVFGSNVGATTSPQAGSCNMTGDRWYVYVPASDGNLRASVASSDAGYTNYNASVAVFSGACGSLVELGCDSTPGAGGSSATVTVPVEAGVPLHVAVGGTGGTTGRYSLRLTVEGATPPKLNPTNGHAYSLTPSPMSFTQARAWAASQGGTLTAINDAAENAWVHANFGSPGGQKWIGYTDEVAEGTWAWETGEPFGYENWSAGQPDDWPACGGEDYGTMRFPLDDWNDTGEQNCGGGLLYGIVEVVPAGTLPQVTSQFVGCPAEAPPNLYSAPHQIGQLAHLAVTAAPPLTSGVLWSSGLPPAVSPSPVACEVHFDLLTAVPTAVFTSDVWGAWAHDEPVPANPALVGTQTVWQAQLFPPGLPGLMLTNAIYVTIGG